MSKTLERSNRKKYDWLLDYEEVTDWIKKYKSERTQRVYLQALNLFCEYGKVRIEDLLENSPEANERLIEYVRKELLETRTPRLVINMTSSINSFLRFHGKKLQEVLIDGHDEYGRYAPKTEGEKVYGWLLGFESIRNWIDTYDSPNTRQSYLTNMHNFCKRAKITPDELLELEPKQIRGLYRKVRSQYIQEGKTAAAKNCKIALSTFLSENEVDVTFTRRDKVQVAPKRIKIQHIPTKDEIYRMADNSGSLRNRALILFLYQSGVRVNAIERLTYGLVKDSLYPELKVPVQIRISSDIDTKISKFNLGYYVTFLQDEGAEALKTYLDYRKESEGWIPKDGDLIFIPETFLNEEREQRGLKSWRVLEIVKKAAKSIGLDRKTVWTHLIRKSFRKILYKAPIDNDMAEAIFGHQIEGSKENYFDRNDQDWIASEYMKAPFSREGVGRLNHLEKENIILRENVEDMGDKYEYLTGVIERLSKALLGKEETKELLEKEGISGRELEIFEQMQEAMKKNSKKKK